ncbi:PhzF family phenazine biosynthesis protein [Gorillibacterium massiliense]|uniref:PhzF family phenazine biosynthesis protein n=1 Tax=Gorillibacterium massiliense TaxID=1280390 RepID=UPI0004AEE5EF|nr:PhzF family phenazine biosynthesis protein [Gorillibacterium massiliense]
MKYHVVDVFAQTKYAGNPLAVFIGAGHLSGEEMQAIAREINYAETTFVLSEDQRNGGYDVRIFTTNYELPFAGHPSLGTAYIIRKEIIKQPVETVTLNLKAGQIPVSFGEGAASPLTMKQIPPRFGETLTADDLAAVLGILPEDIDSRTPIQVVNNGIGAAIVPLSTLQAVKSCRINRDAFRSFLNRNGIITLLVYTPEAVEAGHDVHVRVFVDDNGFPEDPATGSACGCLAGYLVKHRIFGSASIDVKAEQGYEIGRPSLLYLKADEQEDGSISVSVGGNVIPVAHGEWLQA